MNRNKVFDYAADAIDLAAAVARLSVFDDADSRCKMPEVKEVIFNPPATIVNWTDGTKTVARCAPEDKFNEEFGFAMACAKKLVEPYETFQDYIKRAVRVKAKTAKKTAQKKKTATYSEGKNTVRRKRDEKAYNAVRDLFKLLSDDSVGEIEIKFG